MKYLPLLLIISVLTVSGCTVTTWPPTDIEMCDGYDSGAGSTNDRTELDCYNYFIKDSTDYSICEYIGEKYKYNMDSCKVYVAINLNDIDTCRGLVGATTVVNIKSWMANMMNIGSGSSTETVHYKDFCLNEISKNTLENNCNDIENNVLKDECFVTLALELKDPTLCEGVVSSDTENADRNSRAYNECIFETAIASGQPQFCSNIAFGFSTTNEHNCYKDIFYQIREPNSTLDVSMCELFEDANYKIDCIAVFENDASSCIESFCFTKLAILNSDATICEQTSDIDIITPCYFSYAVTKLDVDVCDKISPESTNCYHNIANTLNDPTICDKIISDEEAKSFCIEAANR
ncbi:hypothetical protein ACFLQN_00920 [Candidatus Aenigmatarchaeota archaeon]